MQVTIPVIRQNQCLRLHELKSELARQGVSLEDVPSGMVLRFMGGAELQREHQSASIWSGSFQDSPNYRDETPEGQ